MPIKSEHALCIFFIVVLSLSGCSTPPSVPTSERALSLELSKKQINFDETKLLEAVCFVLSFKTEPKQICMKPDGSFNLDLGPDNNFRQALATAITEDGYLLTARHAVGQVTYVIARSRGEINLYRARLVHCGPENTRGGDYAIIKIDSASIDYLTESLVSPEKGHSVFSVVFEPKGQEIGGSRQFAAGLVSAIQSGSNDIATLIDVSVPLRAGDSGGPLVGKNGELFGITSGWEKQNFISPKIRRIVIAPPWNAIRMAISSDRLAKRASL